MLKFTHTAAKITTILVLACLATQSTPKRFTHGRLDTFKIIKKSENQKKSTNSQTAKNLEQQISETPQTSSPIQGSVEIGFKGGLGTSGGQVLVKLFYTKSRPSGALEGRVFEFSVPFELDGVYQNRKLVYSASERDERFRFGGAGFGVFELDQDFQMFRGRSLSGLVRAERLQMMLFIEKLGLEGRNQLGGNDQFSAILGQFELWFEADGVINRLSVDPRSLQEEYFAQKVSFSTLLIFGIGAVLFFQNWIIRSIYRNLDKEEQNNALKFAGALVFTLFSPFFILPIFKNLGGFMDLGASLIIFAVLSAQNLATYELIIRVFGQKTQNSLRSILAILVKNWQARWATALSIAWILTLFVQPSLVFHSYAVYTLIFVADLIAAFKSPENPKEALKSDTLSSALTAVRGFLLQAMFLMLYTLIFYMAHSEAPPALRLHFAVDLTLLGLLIATSCLASIRRRSEVEKSPKMPKMAEITEMIELAEIEGYRAISDAI